MPNGTWAKITIFLAAGVWFITSLLMGLPAGSSWLRPLGTTTSIVVFAFVLFDVLIWRWLPYWIVKLPNLRGTWRAILTSNRVDEDGKPIELICFLVIRQSYSRIHLEMLFPESESGSTSADIVRTDGTTELWYSYRSIAHALNRKGNPPHMGAARLRIAIGKNIKFSGDYWTDRETFGRIETTAHSKKTVSDYKDATKIFE